MSYRDCLPHSHIEMWIIRIAFFVITFWAGVGTGVIWTQLFSRSNFTGGAEWMQRAYTTGGMVERITITGNSKREKE